MALFLHVHGGYPSYHESGEKWGQSDYDALKFVQALKGHPINGYAMLPKADGTWVRITNEDRQGAFEIFGQWGAGCLSRLPIKSGLLVPVPSSDCLELGTDEKGRRLAQAIAKYATEFSVSDCLHWDQPLGKAADGGTRNAEVLFENICVQTEIAPSNVILIDDVATSGGHLQACARALRHFGHTVEHALCAAQTVWTHPENMFAIPTRDLEA